MRNTAIVGSRPVGAADAGVPDLEILVGQALNRADGEPIICARVPSAVLGALVSRQRVALPDAWAILGTFKGDRRGESGWQRASGVFIDLDWEDPTLPKESGAHHPVPELDRQRVVAALKECGKPGFAYLTPRGLRVGHLLAKDVSDRGGYTEIAEAAGEMILRHLGEYDVPLWRNGVTGLRYDSTSSRPSQPMRLPLPAQPAMVFGEDRALDQSELGLAGPPRLKVDAALPRVWACAAKGIADWAQVPVELVAAELLVLASALVGNTREILFQGRADNLSLQLLALLESGSGKSDVRELLRRHTQFIEDDLAVRREDAIGVQEKYEGDLARWSKDQSAKKPDPQIERPSLPPGPGIRTRQCFYVSDHTSEGLGAVLQHSTRGVLLEAHEAHVVLSAGRYATAGASSKASQERALLRQWFDGQCTSTVRKGERRVNRVIRPFVAASLDAQPGMEHLLFNDEDAVSGTRARWLIHRPLDLAGQVRYRGVAQVPEGVTDSLRSAIAGIWNVPLAEDAEGWPSPRPLVFEPDTEGAYLDWLERMEPARARAVDAERAYMSHMRGRIRRITGVLAVMRSPETNVIELNDFKRGIAWASYWTIQHDYVWGTAGRAKEYRRLEALVDRVERVYAAGDRKGVSTTDLRRRLGGRYKGPMGAQCAIADLNEIGWNPRVPVWKGRGRRPLSVWHPPGASTESTKLPPPRSPSRSVDSVDRSPSLIRSGASARELLDRASVRLIATNSVSLPPVGKRAACAVCGSSDGLGTLPDEPHRWYCHSDRHQRGGCAVDLLLLEQLGREPTPAEAVEKACEILGEGVTAEAPPGNALRNLRNEPADGAGGAGNRLPEAALAGTAEDEAVWVG